MIYIIIHVYIITLYKSLQQFSGGTCARYSTEVGHPGLFRCPELQIDGKCKWSEALHGVALQFCIQTSGEAHQAKTSIEITTYTYYVLLYTK